MAATANRRRKLALNLKSAILLIATVKVAAITNITITIAILVIPQSVILRR